jgi:SAM-dependent methyltransferase
MKVLDLGCGPGRLTVPIAERLGPHGKVMAVDIHAGMLRRAQAKAQAAGLTNVEFLRAAEERASCRTIPSRLSHRLGRHCRSRGRLREVFDSLKPGGFLSITETILDLHFQSPGAVRRLATTAGFVETVSTGSAVER